MHTSSKVYVKKSITITEEQNKFLEENCINLSRFVQKKIEEKVDE